MSFAAPIGRTIEFPLSTSNPPPLALGRPSPEQEEEEMMGVLLQSHPHQPLALPATEAEADQAASYPASVVHIAALCCGDSR